MQQAQAQVLSSQAAVENAAVDLSRCTIYAPVDGVVISRNVDVGQTVAASLSAPTIFIIANDLAKMQIDANVSEADIGTIEERQNVSFTVDAFLDRKFTGKVRQIRNSPTMVQNVVTYDVVIALEGPISMTSCTSGSKTDCCDLESRCRVHHNWQKLNRVVIGALARVSLAEMAHPMPESAFVTLEVGSGAGAGRATGGTP